MRAFFLITSLLACSAALAQMPTDLALRKDFQAGRASSTDPKLRNGDNRYVKPHSTITVADVKGPGRFTHLWFTIASQDPDPLRTTVLRIYWDDATKPAVECPMGDFFAQGPGHYVEFTSAPVAVGGQMGLNCYWPMPFKHHAVVTVSDDSDKPIPYLYFNLDYRQDRRWNENDRYFHTQYRNYFPAPKGQPLTICDAKGSGHYVGTVVTVQANSDGWWGEGNDNWYVDGATKPTISGTGSEDYFCGGWDFGHSFQNTYFGVTWYDNAKFGGEKRGIQNTAYRWHIMDPVPFKSSLLFTLEHGGAGFDEDRNPYRNNYTTVGMYYSDNPEGEGPALPPLDQRIPKLIGE